jgi:hypothetical protein
MAANVSQQPAASIFRIALNPRIVVTVFSDATAGVHMPPHHHLNTHFNENISLKQRA